MLWDLIDGLLLAYARADDEFLLPFWLVGFALTPLTVLIHELGHGIVGMAITRRPVKLRVGLGRGWCKLTGDRQITVLAYTTFVAAGPLASLGQVLLALWLAASAAPGSVTQWVLFAGALVGVLGGLTALVPLEHKGVRSDGQTLLDLGRWIFGGPRPRWFPRDEPHVASSFPPPG